MKLAVPSSRPSPPSLEAQLVITPSVPVWRKEGKLFFDRKFYEGMCLYGEKWPGPLKCVLSRSDAPLPDFGTVAIELADLPFECRVLEPGERIGAGHLAGAALVLASGDDFDQLHLSRLCASIGIKCVYVIEYIPETRHQIVALSTPNPLRRLRRHLYLWRGEQKRLRAFAQADGLQSNGMPAYREYGGFRNNLLFFDTRVHQGEMIGEAELDRRLACLNQGGPLRLAFSGRLIRMKGADHLVQLARRLDRSGLAFHMTIYGAGELEAEMRAFIAREGLEDRVALTGALDFHERLLPDLKSQVDLFICLHRQSDPSCTYLETLSCGVPILGYENRAFAGLLGEAAIGWGAALEDLAGIGDRVLWPDRHREALAEAARTGAHFARSHGFEATFQRRIDHLVALCRNI
ncbi:MAG: glycosyl transferase family 1 [Gammaproteobacteria bacterium RIFOXYA12_FULL_61_12]|nr:MAG: glycosyl transferase family 1 [Gammaproteobacteria bacterium RIFOXYA12_FULL_61_12]